MLTKSDSLSSEAVLVGLAFLAKHLRCIRQFDIVGFVLPKCLCIRV